MALPFRSLSRSAPGIDARTAPAVPGPPCLRGLAVALLALLLHTAPGHAQPEARIWGRITLKDGEQREGFLRFHGEQNAASWGDIFESRQDIGDGPRQSWIEASRGHGPFVRTLELRGYRISWNDRSDDFPRQRTIRVPFGSVRAIVVHNHNLEVALRSGTEDQETPGSRAGRLVGEMDDDWPETRIDVDHPLNGITSISGEDVERIDFSAAPGGREASSARLAGIVEDDSGRSFRGLVTWDDRAVLLSDTLGRRLSESSEPPIRFDEVRSIERDADGTRATLASGEVVELTGGGRRVRTVSVRVGTRVQVQVEHAGRGRNPADEIMVVDPELGTVTIDWDDFSALRLDPADVGAASGYDDFDGALPLRGVVVTHDGEELEGRIRWNGLKEWSWDRLHAYSDGVEIATAFGRIRSIEQIAFPDTSAELRQVPGSSERGRALLTLRDGRTYEVTGYNDLGLRNLGILVQTGATAGEPGLSSASGDGADAGTGIDGDWRFVGWDDVREVRFVHDRGADPGP
ncbi:MAG: hypothetical protein F4059_07865 [Gemmatimonadetes bacterium]|nr:hypothetical protein [Gemmatimonadota bacterium]